MITNIYIQTIAHAGNVSAGRAGNRGRRSRPGRGISGAVKYNYRSGVGESIGTWVLSYVRPIRLVKP